MSTIVFSNYAQALRNRREITASNAMSLRRQIWADRAISAEEADMLLTLDMECPKVSAEWKELFVEALTDYVVNQMAPKGTVDDAKAQWLIARIGSEGHVATEAEMELLMKVMEKADPVPESLRLFLLSHVAYAARSAGTMSQADFGLLRHALYSVRIESAEAATVDLSRLSA